MSTCTNQEAMSALGYLHRSFTCTDLDAQGERSLLNTFRRFSVDDVRAALEHFKVVSAHWPLPAQLEKWMAQRVAERTAGQRDRARAKRDGPFLEDYDESLTDAVIWCAGILAARSKVATQTRRAPPVEIEPDPQYAAQFAQLRANIDAGIQRNAQDRAARRAKEKL